MVIKAGLMPLKMAGIKIPIINAAVKYNEIIACKHAYQYRFVQKPQSWHGYMSGLLTFLLTFIA